MNLCQERCVNGLPCNSSSGGPLPPCTVMMRAPEVSISRLVKPSSTAILPRVVAAEPSGYINYQPDGRIFVVLVGDRVKPAGQVPSDAEKIQLFGTLVAYS